MIGSGRKPALAIAGSRLRPVVNTTSVGLILGSFAIQGASGCSSNDCAARAQAYEAAAVAAQQCNPDAATPCVTYLWSTSAFNPGCGHFGINPDAGSSLNALLHAYIQAGCPGVSPACPALAPPVYACQPDAGGVSTCIVIDGGP